MIYGTAFGKATKRTNWFSKEAGGLAHVTQQAAPWEWGVLAAKALCCPCQAVSLGVV